MTKSQLTLDLKRNIVVNPSKLVILGWVGGGGRYLLYRPPNQWDHKKGMMGNCLGITERALP